MFGDLNREDFMKRVDLFIKQHEFVLLILICAVFFLLTIPGISWGAPDLWHPDEILRRVIFALAGEWRFDETNFDYPSLPKYILYGLGLLVYKLGYNSIEYIIAARSLSVVIGAIVIVFAYRITRMLSGKVFPSILTAMLLISNHHFSLNARWAHNDPYITLFVILSIFALLNFTKSRQKLWLYGSFFVVGLAASSKYNGGSLIIAPILITLLIRSNRQRTNYLEILETLFIGIVLSFLGYAIGTPKSALWMAYYLKRVIPALQRHSTYGRDPISLVGILGQWKVLKSLQGYPLYIWGLFSIAVILVRLARQRLKHKGLDNAQIGLAVVIVAILALDLPILFSYNLQARFFLPVLPLIAILSSITFQDTINFFFSRGYRYVKTISAMVLGMVLVFNLLKVISVTLLFQNDSRISASTYLPILPEGTSIEFTLYPPYSAKRPFFKGA